MKAKLFLTAIALILTVVFAGCHSNTTEGIGRDVQKIGQKIEG